MWDVGSAPRVKPRSAKGFSPPGPPGAPHPGRTPGALSRSPTAPAEEGAGRQMQGMRVHLSWHGPACCERPAAVLGCCTH